MPENELTDKEAIDVVLDAFNLVGNKKTSDVVGIMLKHFKEMSDDIDELKKISNANALSMETAFSELNKRVAALAKLIDAPDYKEIVNVHRQN